MWGEDMNKKLLLTLLAAIGVGLLLGATRASATTQGLALPVAFNQAIANAIPAPGDDPLLDANGNVVRDAQGNPVSDPNEPFHQVKPQEYDPAHTNLVQAAWMNAIGCPSGANVATYPSTTVTGTFTDSACATGDPRDQHNEGLLLAKTGPTDNNAAAIAQLKKVRGLTLTELGFDIRKMGTSTDPRGSHCGAGAPRWNVQTTTNFYFIGCNSPPPDQQIPSSTGWIRMRWGAGGTVMGFCVTCTPPFLLQPVTGTVQSITIVFDEGQDAGGGPDQFGAAVLDNIDVNGTMVGHGACDCD
jgi:hypothetical protein